MDCKGTPVDTGQRCAIVIEIMKKSKLKKQWKKPQIRVVQVCCECTAYVDAS
jgi:hypothetical protein